MPIPRVKVSPKMKKEMTDIRKAALAFRAINHDLRLAIFDYLMTREATVTELYKKFKIEQSVASQHLSILRKQDFLKVRKSDRYRYYSANTERLAAVKSASQEIAL